MTRRGVYAISVGLIALGLGTPWAVWWSGWLRGDAPAIAAEEREPQVRTLRPVMRELPGGTFMMGSSEDEPGRNDDEGPQRRVAISSFQMCQTEVTQENYQAVMGTNPSDCKYGCGLDMPVQNVNWLDAIEYLNELTQIENRARTDVPKMSLCYEKQGDAEWEWKPGCTGYRLPTEAEWEYAARAGSQTRYYFGDDEGELGDHAWYEANAGGKVHPVGSTRRQNHPWGLHDMYGNVWEWVWDWFTLYKVSESVVFDPKGPESGDSAIIKLGDEPTRVLRGGGFVGFEARYLRSANRLWDRPRNSGVNVGFRCVRGFAEHRAIAPLNP